jgi:hypothetical protein
MNKILVDSSAWIEYFRSSKSLSFLDELIESNQICINDLILTELIPYLHIKGLSHVIVSLKTLDKVPLNIQWDLIIQMQIINLQNGINKVGIPDLIILQHVIDNNLILFSLDKHFRLMKAFFEFQALDFPTKST